MFLSIPNNPDNLCYLLGLRQNALNFTLSKHGNIRRGS